MANIVLIPNELSGLNYSIAPSVASNNLTVAIKDAAGSNPSASSPCTFRVGGSERLLSTSLSVTKNAGTNWAGLGSTAAAGVSGFATLEQDLFVYIVWNTNTSALDVLWSRIPYATLYSDFSSTTTNEKYGAINATAPAATDEVVNIGRFAATLGATASFNWSVPTFSSANLKNRPTFETRWRNYVPYVDGYSTDPTTTVYIYQFEGNNCRVTMREGGAGTSDSVTHTYTAPFTAATRTNMVWWGASHSPMDNSVAIATGNGSIASASATITMIYGAAAWTASGSSRVQAFNILYEI